MFYYISYDIGKQLATWICKTTTGHRHLQNICIVKVVQCLLCRPLPWPTNINPVASTSGAVLPILVPIKDGLVCGCYHIHHLNFFDVYKFIHLTMLVIWSFTIKLFNVTRIRIFVWRKRLPVRQKRWHSIYYIFRKTHFKIHKMERDR